MEIFDTEKPIIGMTHLLPLPGSPQFADSDHILNQASKDYKALKKGGVDSVLIENFGDVPYCKNAVDPCTVSWMTKIILSLQIDLPFGVNVLRNDVLSALAIAHATGGSFIRCNVLSGTMVTDQGIIEGNASQVVRYRNSLGDIKIFADVMVKHAHPLTEQSIEGAARDTAYRALADALVITGVHTGAPPHLEDIVAAKKAVGDKPVLAGSGVTLNNVESILDHADGCIVGCAFKKGQLPTAAVEEKKVRNFMKKVNKIR